MGIYLPAMTDEELVAYCDSYSETDLEKELVLRLKNLLDVIARLKEA